MRRFHCVEFVFAVGQSEADSEESDAEEEEPAAAGMPPAEEEEEVEFQPPPEWTEGSQWIKTSFKYRYKKYIVCQK